MKDKSATRYDQISYLDMLQKQLKVLDLTAVSLCMDHHMPVVVFDMKKEGNIEKAIRGERIGTLVGDF